MDIDDPVLLKHRELEQIAMATLRLARLLMETGARAEVVQEGAALAGRGLGAEHVDLRSGYASLDITVGSGGNTITRMMEVGPLGVNYRLNHAVRALARRIERGGLTPAVAVAELARLERTTPGHPAWLIAVAAGLACAAFGRLLGVDWPAFLPIAAAGAIGQAARHALKRRGANVFVAAAGVALLSSLLGGLGARWAGSATVDLAMISAVLLLVPGVPALNAQSDIMEGHPTLGSARAVSVVMLLMFVAVGVLMAQTILAARP